MGRTERRREDRAGGRAAGRGRARAALALAAALAGCASAAEPRPLDAPPPGPVGPALAVAAPVLAVEATPDRPLLRAGAPARAFERLVCAACAEEADPAPGTGPRAPCAACGGGTFREAFSPPYRPRLDLPGVAAAAAATLAGRGTFERVVALPAGVADAREAARAAGARWLLEARLDRAAVAYAARPGVFALELVDLVVCSLFVFPGIDPPNWFLASEEYALEVRGWFTLVDLVTDLEVTGGPLEARVAGAFAELGPGPTREWHLVGFLRAPGCLEEDEWAEVAAELVPAAQTDLARELARRVEAARR